MNDSQYPIKTGAVITPRPARFDALIMKKLAREPGPASYRPQEDLVKKNHNSSTSFTSVRMHDKRWHTLTPGVGSYRMQPGFGVYSPSDT